MIGVVDNGTVVADHTWKAGVLTNAVVETVEIVG